jgi:hypothetical protein
MLNKKRIGWVSNAELYRRTQAQPLAFTMMECQLIFLGALYSSLYGKRRPGSLKMDNIKRIQD